MRGMDVKGTCGLRKRLEVVLGLLVALLLGMTLSACGTSPVVGSWYEASEDVSQPYCTFDADHTGMLGNAAFEWKEEGDTITVTLGLLRSQGHLTPEGTLQFYDTVYYRTPEEASEAYQQQVEEEERAKKEAEDKAAAEQDACVESLEESLIGTWNNETDGEEPESQTVTFEDDGTWRLSGSLYKNVYENFQNTSVQVDYNSSGTWSFEYHGSDPEVFDPARMQLDIEVDETEGDVGIHQNAFKPNICISEDGGSYDTVSSDTLMKVS